MRKKSTTLTAACPFAAPPSLREWGTARGVKYFLVSYTDLFGVQRSKLARPRRLRRLSALLGRSHALARSPPAAQVPTAAMDMMQRVGASFAGFATYLDSRASEPDTFAKPDASAAVVLPWKREVAWVPSDLVCRGAPIAHAPRNVLKAQAAAAAARGFTVKTGVEVEFFLLSPDGKQPADRADDAVKPCYDQQALMRQYDLISEVCGARSCCVRSAAAATQQHAACSLAFAVAAASSDYMAELGWGPYQNDHEDANGQFEAR
jgi:glutamine synthetase